MRSLLFLVLTILLGVNCNVISLDDSNIDKILHENGVVLVNFYADWCRFSQQLKPIFEKASNEFNGYPQGKVAWASVDADRQPGIAGKYHVNKYPTLKLFRNGEIVKKEYRSQRSVEALTAYVKKQLENEINVVDSQVALQQKIDTSKRNVVGIFPALSGPAYDNFIKIASILREDCTFYIGTGAGFQQQTAQGPAVTFRSPGEGQEDHKFTGDLNNFDFAKAWLTDKCVPLIREITFENAEELTEEGKPFLILFKHPDDKESEKVFSEAVLRDIADKKGVVNCLVADGKKFAHPLHHLGKSEQDLPVIAIDSFRHMYLFSDYKDLSTPGKLHQFVLDLESGKLHREFHHGPDPVQPQLGQGSSDGTQPPPSVFEKLKPSHNRYTILDKDEL